MLCLRQLVKVRANHVKSMWAAAGDRSLCTCCLRTHGAIKHILQEPRKLGISLLAAENNKVFILAATLLMLASQQQTTCTVTSVRRYLVTFLHVLESRQLSTCFTLLRRSCCQKIFEAYLQLLSTVQLSRSRVAAARAKCERQLSHLHTERSAAPPRFAAS